MSRTTRITTIASLVLFLGIMSLWVRSYWASDGIGRRQHAVNGWTDTRGNPRYARALSVYTFEGGVAFESATFSPALASGGVPTAEPDWASVWGSVEPRTMPVNNRTLANWLGFGREGYNYSMTGQNMVGRTYAAPLWPFAGLTAALPAVVGIRWLARRSADGPECHACGYDLRGATSGGVCPECGAESRAQAP